MLGSGQNQSIATPTDKFQIEVQYDFEDNFVPEKPLNRNTVAETERSSGEEIVNNVPRKLPRSLRCLQKYNSPRLKE